MAKVKNTVEQTVEPVMPESKTTKIPTETLIKSKRFKENYQQDFMRALLPENEYTVEEAFTILNNYFKGGK